MKRRAKRERETPEFAGAVRRMIRSHGRRVANADVEDLAELVRMVDDLDAAVQSAVDGLRERHSWAEIGRALGVSKQAAYARYGRVDAGMAVSESA